jgi:6-phosphogluconolactonase
MSIPLMPMPGKITSVDIIHSEQNSAPRHVKFSKDGRFLYIVHELKNIIDVYSYQNLNGDAGI